MCAKYWINKRYITYLVFLTVRSVLWFLIICTCLTILHYSCNVCICHHRASYCVHMTSWSLVLCTYDIMEPCIVYIWHHGASYCVHMTSWSLVLCTYDIMKPCIVYIWHHGALYCVHMTSWSLVLCTYDIIEPRIVYIWHHGASYCVHDIMEPHIGECPFDIMRYCQVKQAINCS